MEKAIKEIAKKFFRIETFESRKSDSLDFTEQAVWDIKNALVAAYEAGERAGFKTGENRRF